MRILSSTPFYAGLIGMILFLAPSWSHAQGFGGIGLVNVNAIGDLVPQNLADAMIKTTSFYSVHRPYQGATSIFSYNSIDIYLEATVMKVGSAIPNAMAANGIPVGTSFNNIPAIPTAKIHLRKAIGNWMDIGISGIGYRGQTVVGGDAKIVLYEPEEGPSYAFRFGYTYMNVPVMYTKAHTINPELVMSRKLYFAEPYLGTGLRYAHGTVSIPFQPPVPVAPVYITKSGGGWDEYLFTGLLFRILGPQGILLGIEGSFSLGGFHTMGMTFGLGF